MAELHGFCDERFRLLADAFERHLDEGLDKGASLAATLHGDPVVDLWGGTRDYAQGLAWEEDTIVRIFSTSKVMVMMTALLLVDRGQLDVDEPIATYWPELSKHGKGAITTKHVLLHQAGLPGFGRELTLDQLADWDGVVSMLEDAELWFEPGTHSCYHFHTFGHLIGETVQRITGMPFDEFFRSEFTDPIDADFHFGLPESENGRVADLWPADRELEVESPMASRTWTELVGPESWIDPTLFPSVMPSGSGITNARALARLGGIIACGGELDGHRFLDPTVIELAGTEHSYTVDEALGPARFGLGFGLDSPEYPAPTSTSLHWGGYGGSFLTMDPLTGISCGFAPNQLRLDDGARGDARRVEFWELLGEISRELSP